LLVSQAGSAPVPSQDRARILERRINQMLARVREEDEQAGPAGLAAATNALLRAYRGLFLGQDAEPWAIQARDRLHGRYLKSLKKLGDYWEKQENWEVAQACYERSMEVDIALARCA